MVTFFCPEGTIYISTPLIHHLPLSLPFWLLLHSIDTILPILHLRHLPGLCPQLTYVVVFDLLLLPLATSAAGSLAFMLLVSLPCISSLAAAGVGSCWQSCLARRISHWPILDLPGTQVQKSAAYISFCFSFCFSLQRATNNTSVSTRARCWTCIVILSWSGDSSQMAGKV